MKKVAKMSCKKKPNPNKEDFKRELEFAKEYVRGEVFLPDFPDYESYVKTLAKEKLYLQKGRILVVGCGPLPISMMLLGSRADGMDRSREAIEHARKVLWVWDNTGTSDNTSTSYVLLSKAEDFDMYRIYPNILLTLEAGTSVKKKRKILNVIHTQMDPYAVLIVRSSVTNEFVKLEDNMLTEQFDIIGKHLVFDNLCKSYILKKK